jgi:hypothetical protein
MQHKLKSCRSCCIPCHGRVLHTVLPLIRVLSDPTLSVTTPLKFNARYEGLLITALSLTLSGPDGIKSTDAPLYLCKLPGTILVPQLLV